jgi:hypothetical protein
MGVAIIIMVIIIYGTMNKIDNFNNSNVTGEYIGTVSFDGYPTFDLNITFNGQGSISGAITNHFNITFEFSGPDATYQCIQNTVSFNFGNESQYFIFLGDASPDYSVITGNATYNMDNSSTTLNGQFSITNVII